jgi:hypothetical protein
MAYRCLGNVLMTLGCMKRGKRSMSEPGRCTSTVAVSYSRSCQPVCRGDRIVKQTGRMLTDIHYES